MKKVALTVAVLALGLAACETKTENAVDNTVPSEGNAGEEDSQCCRRRHPALDSAGNAVEDAGNAVENAADATANASDNAL